MPHLMYFFEDALRTTPRYLMPPGYVTVPEFRKRVQAPDVHGSANWDDLVAINRIVAGHAREGRRRGRQPGSRRRARTA